MARADRRRARPAGHRLGPPLGVLGPRRDGRRARRRLQRDAGRADQRRRRTTAGSTPCAYASSALPVRDDVVRENEWFAPTRGSASSPADRRHLARGLPRGPGRGGRARRRRARRLRVRRPARSRGSTAGTTAATCCGSAGRRTPTGSTRCSTSGLRTGDPLPGCRRPADDGAAQDHQRRLAQHPDRVVLRASTPTRTVLEHPAGLPNQSGAELRSLLGRATPGRPRGRHPRDRRRGRDRGAGRRTPRPGRPARSSTRSWSSREDVRRMAELGLRASVQPAHLLDDRDLTEKIWPGRGERCFAFRWMLDDGVELALGSDAPVSPLDPWLAIAAAVHRSADDRDPWHAEQSLTPARGAGRVGRRSADRRRRLPRRPGAARPRPAGGRGRRRTRPRPACARCRSR